MINNYKILNKIIIALSSKGVVHSVGNMIGVGKESDVYVVSGIVQKDFAYLKILGDGLSENIRNVYQKKNAFLKNYAIRCIFGKTFSIPNIIPKLVFGTGV